MKEIEIPLASTDKYEEALAKARFEYKENPCASEGEKRLLEIIFPELKESDDERIRKSIVAIINQYARMCEKEGDPCEASLIEDALAYLEKQKGQQPAEWSDDFQENIRILLHDKLTWRSEDGTMSSTAFIDNETLKDIISGIWFYVGKEALKYPNKELNVSKWSEEDEQWLESIIKDYEDSLTKDKDHAAVIKIKIDFLKSLRPQPHWKPSEEQLRQLHIYVSSDNGPLTDLYKQLIKL